MKRFVLQCGVAQVIEFGGASMAWAPGYGSGMLAVAKSGALI